MSALRVLVPLLLALLLVLVAQLLARNPAVIPTADCRSGPDCVLVGDLLRDLSSLKFDLQREQFDKSELPLLSLYLSNGALQKLDGKRRATLAKPGQILLGEDGDWVRGSFIVDDGKTVVEGKTQLRLKGDWADHIKHPSKLSFRFKVQAPDYVFGMRRFSIQHPKTRKFHAEPLLLDEMRRWDIVAPRYRFVDVRINDYRIGVMALEEHYSKELLEAQRRREGPIVVLDEDIMWRQKDLNHRVNALRDAKFDTTDLHVAPWDLAVREFRPPPYVPGSNLTTNSIRALSLYRDYIDGRIPAVEAFDLQKMARWWVLTNVWNGCHAAVAHNRRFYFNPTTNLLEPISFDNLPMPLKYPAQGEPCDDLVALYLLGDGDFQRHVLDFSEQLLASYQDPVWQQEFRQSQLRLMAYLGLEKMPVERIYIKDLLSNLATFLTKVRFTDNQRHVSNATRNFARDYPTAELYSQLRAFVYPDSEHGMLLELKNLSGETLEALQVSLPGELGTPRQLIAPNRLPAYQRSSSDHLLELPIDEDFTASGTQVRVDYMFRGEPQHIIATPQFRDHDTDFSRQWPPEWRAHTALVIDEEKRLVQLKGGLLRLASNLQFPRGWAFQLDAGSRLSLEGGATIKLQGPLLSLGTAASPVRVEIEPDEGYRGVGAWGGILVMQSEQRSVVQHTRVSGAGGRNLVNRQDYHGITGCISFYESDVELLESRFSNLHCEDALNIVRADFVLEDIVISGARADGFDSDFSRGVVRDSLFENTGNDGIDVSGTRLEIANTRFLDIGDKAVSVGEASSLQASHLEIIGAATGVASKDLSEAIVEDSRFSAIRGSSLITYVKKGEYGGANLRCNRCDFLDAESVITNQQGSKIIIDGKLQSVTDFNQGQMMEAGYVLNEQ
jgi:hypothetical protein